MATKPTKKESRTRTPPEKKKLKCSEHSMLTFQEEAEPSIKIWENRSEIQELAIKPEDLIKTHLPRSTEEQQVYPRESHILIRKCNDKVEKNANLLVAHQQCPEYAARDALFSGLEIPLMDNYGEILPHHVLGTLQELNREAASPGNTLVPELLAESMNQNLAFGSQIEKRGLGQRKPSDEQDLAINNWQHHMALRKKQLDSLSRHLNKPLGKLLMNTYEDLWPLEEKRRMIRQSSSATESCKGMRSQKEFWNMPEHIGDDFSGLLLTLTKSERGYALPSVHIGKAKSILLETGLVDKPLIHSTRDKRPRLQQCQYAEGAAMEEFEHSKLEIDNLEVVGRGKCFPYVAADSFGSSNEAEVTCPKENQDALHIFPDMPDIVLGPSLLFCGQQASWIEHTASHRDRVGICAHVTFESHTGEKSSSTLEIVNNGSTAIWYEWRRLPSNVKLEGHHKAFQSQKFFFNTCTGVVLPGKTQVFPFHFKSTTAGVFMEDWEFCTHPVLLAGALLQVSLWGIALHEDKVSQLREALEKQLMAREAAIVAQEIVWELLEDACTTDRPQSPLTCDAEEDLFNIVNPKTLECVPEDETREVLHFQFNVNISQSSLLPKEAAVDFLQEACIQLWREGIDNFVERAQFLRYISGMPEKNVHTEYPVEEAADKTHLKGSKEEKKGDKLKEEKGTPGGKEKEDKRGLKAESFSRTDKDVFSNNQNGKEEMKPLEPLGTNQDYNNLVPSGESFDLMGQQSHLFQEYPAFQEKYTESLYTEVYGLLLSMVRNLVIIAESLEPRRFVSEPDNMNPNN